MLNATKLLHLSTLAMLAAGSITSAAAAQNPASCPTCEAGAALVTRYGLVEAAAPVRERRGWAPLRRIVTIDSAVADQIRLAAPGAEVFVLPHPDAARILAEADALVGLCDPAVLTRAANLRWIQTVSAGVDECAAMDALKERDVLVTNAQRISGPQIAEHAIAIMFSFARGLSKYAVEQRAQRWSGEINTPAMVLGSGHWELSGKTMLVVGLGGIGTEVARRANALGMRVLATRNSSREGPEFVEYVGLANEVNDLAARADVVVSAVPLTPETTGMFDAAFFRAMKPSAYFISVGRGETAVTDDLVEALRRGDIAGAGLDVTDPEPLPPGHPLWSLPNAIVTPHIAVASDSFLESIVTLVKENIRRYQAGERMLSVVDLTRGY